MSHYRPLPKIEDCGPFAFDPPLKHDQPPQQVARLFDELPLGAMPAAVPHEDGAFESSEAGPEDDAASLRQSMLAEIEAALATEDGEIACFHVTLANVYARRLVALGSAEEPQPD